MKTDPILQEVWNTKDRLAAQAGYDMRRFYEQLREWETAHPHPAPVVNVIKLPAMLVKQDEAESRVLREEPLDRDEK